MQGFLVIAGIGLYFLLLALFPWAMIILFGLVTTAFFALMLWGLFNETPSSSRGDSRHPRNIDGRD